jgi:hypothetical protein
MLQKIGVGLSCFLLIAFLACGGSKNQSQPPGGQQASGQTTQPQASTPPPAAEAPALPQTAPAQDQPPLPAPKPEAARAQRATEKPAAPRVTTQPPTAPPSATATNPPSEPVAKAVAPTVQPKSVPEPPVVVPPQPKFVSVPSGTRFDIRLANPISSEKNKSGENFRATLDQDLVVDGKVVIPVGSLVTGKIIDAKQSGRVEGRAAMSITLTQITVGDVSHPIQTNTLSFEAEKTLKDDATKVGIGAGIGAIIGAIAGGGKGAAIGAAVGGGAGTATVLATKGKEVTFQAEERFSFVLSTDLRIRQ